MPVGAQHGAWSSAFTSGGFRHWTWYGQGQSAIWGDIAVVNPAKARIPPLYRSDPHVARMTVSRAGAADGRINAKLYQAFDTIGPQGVTHSPANVSGTYAAWYYIPSEYRVPPGDWSNIFQFKERYPLPDGQAQSDPLWWVQLTNGSQARSYPGASWISERPSRPDQPVAVLNYWGNDWKRHVVFDAVPLDRWFEIVAVLTQGSEIQFYIDGQPFDTAYAAQYHISPFHRSSEAWYFGVGNYSTAPGTTLYVGQASFTPLLPVQTAEGS
jgi:hypothetical protein